MHQNSSSHIGNSRHLFLIEWKKGDSPHLDQMVYRLKSDNSTAAWSFYAKQLLLTKSINFDNYNVLVPIPGSRPSSIHSLVFAEEIAKLTGLPVAQLLSKQPNSPEQKSVSLVMRKKLFLQKQSVSEAEEFTKCIFVDDVLTSGQSFYQANRVVGNSEENMIITLFYRSKSY